MEQSSMFYHYQSSSFIAHNYKANKGLNFKKALQVALLVGFGLWFLYQIKNKNSNIKQKNYYTADSKRENDISQEIGMNILIGRKGKVGVVVGSALEENGRREDGGVGDDELDGDIEEVEQMKTNGNDSDSGVKEGAENFTSEKEGNGKNSEISVQIGGTEKREEETRQDDMLHGIHSFHDQTGVLLHGLYLEK